MAGKLWSNSHKERPSLVAYFNSHKTIKCFLDLHNDNRAQFVSNLLAN